MSAQAKKPWKKSDGIFRRLNMSANLPHGAFRLWHTLYDHADASGFCWPSIRRIAKMMGCNYAMICGDLGQRTKDDGTKEKRKNWIEELVEAGFLEVIQRHERAKLKFQLLDGDGAKITKGRKKNSASKTGSSASASKTGSRKSACSSGSPSACSSGNRSNYPRRGIEKVKDGASLVSGFPAEPESGAVRKSVLSQLDELESK